MAEMTEQDHLRKVGFQLYSLIDYLACNCEYTDVQAIDILIGVLEVNKRDLNNGS